MPAAMPCLLTGYTGLFQQLSHPGRWLLITNSERRKGRLREAVAGSRSHTAGKVELGLEGWDSEPCPPYTPCWLWDAEVGEQRGCVYSAFPAASPGL